MYLLIIIPYQVSTSDRGENYLKIPHSRQSRYFKPNVLLEVSLLGLAFTYSLFKTEKFKNLFSIINSQSYNLL